MICGIDEAGYGSIAGPLIVVGVALEEPIKGVRDSKAVKSEEERDQLYLNVVETAEAVVVREAEASRIDRAGMGKVWCETVVSVITELQRLVPDSSFVVDGSRTVSHPAIKRPIKYLPKADTLVHQVSAASIVAKWTQVVWAKMVDSEYPEYGFCRHRGYGTEEHWAALDRYGFLDFHRRSYFGKRAFQPRGA